jgi:hypothetical protein
MFGVLYSTYRRYAVKMLNGIVAERVSFGISACLEGLIP